MAALSSGDLGKRALEMARLLRRDLCPVLSAAVDKLCAAADELRAYFAGHFVLACRITKRRQPGNLERKRPSPGSSVKAERSAEKKQMVMR